MKDGRETCPYPLQLSQRKGRRSSWRQKGIWQCAPIASTSPVDILLKDSGWLVGFVFWEAMMVVYDGDIVVVCGDMDAE
jgi:hypothetical protein